ncbi:hypothetical protein GHK52_09980 [Lactococcus garvieae]|nr:hypothetical protein [Lactococcus garvieae]
MFKRLISGAAMLLTVLSIFALSTQAMTATADAHKDSTASLKTENSLPLDTPLYFRLFDYDNHFLGNLGLETYLSWDHNWDYVSLSNRKEVYFKDAGHGRVYIRFGNSFSAERNHVVISSNGSLYLGEPKDATAFAVLVKSDPFYPNQNIYKFFDRKANEVGVYGQFVTVGRGTIPCIWRIVPSLK